MSGDSAALQAKWATLSGTTVSKLQQINAATAPGQVQDIPAEQINALLMKSGKRAGLEAFVIATPNSPLGQSLQAANYLWAIINGCDGGICKFASDPGLIALLAHLADDARTGITAGNVTTVVNLATPQLPWWQANGFTGPIALSDLISAGNLF